MAKEKLDLVHITPQRANELKSEIASLERMLEGDSKSRTPKIQDRAEFNAEIAKRKKELEVHSPKKLEGANANKAYALLKKLDKYIVDRMPSKHDYFRPYPKGSDDHNRHSDFERTVQQQMAFQSDKKLQKAIIARKHIVARLDPDDPTIRSVETLRR